MRISRLPFIVAFAVVVDTLAAQTPPLIRTMGSGYDGAIVREEALSPDRRRWTPTEDNVRELETLLPTYLDSPAALSKLRYTSIRSQLSHYKRQYWGESSGTRRIIRVHFFHEETPIVQKGGWLKSAVSVMGGGDRYLRITYDLDKKQFSELWINAPE
jgi:hypothetical protein